MIIFNKRGLSGVVTTLILILLSLVAVGVIWVVISNIISQGAQDVDIGKFTVDLEVQNVVVNPGNIDVVVKRNPGVGDVTGLKFVVSDGMDSETFNEIVSIDELETKTVSLPYDGMVKSVDVAPLLGTGGNVVGKVFGEEFTDKEMLESLGAISWWRFNGDLTDEIGGYGGSVTGGSISYVDSKFGKGVVLEGSDEIRVPSDPGLNLGSDMSVFAWVKINQEENYSRIIQRSWAAANSWMLMKIGTGVCSDCDKWSFTLVNGTGSQRHQHSDANYSLDIGKWTNLVGTYNGSFAVLYRDGVAQIDSETLSWVDAASTDVVIGGASETSFNGTVDEIILFDKPLTAQQIADLYGYSFS